jgi:hypothetical protein
LSAADKPYKPNDLINQTPLQWVKGWSAKPYKAAKESKTTVEQVTVVEAISAVSGTWSEIVAEDDAKGECFGTTFAEKGTDVPSNRICSIPWCCGVDHPMTLFSLSHSDTTSWMDYLEADISFFPFNPSEISFTQDTFWRPNDPATHQHNHLWATISIHLRFCFLRMP